MLLASFLTACVSSLSPVPEDRYYRLSEVAGKSLGRASLGGVLAIGTIENAGVYNERAILYSESTEPAKLQRYHYHFWTDAPPRLIQDHLAVYLRKASVANTVVNDRGEVDWSHLLSGKLRRFERIMDGSGSRVAVDMEFRLMHNHSRKALLVKDYDVEVEVAGDTVNDAVEAMTRALESIYGQLLADIRRVAR
ncbi:hypothetical protein BOW37_05260 [Solemya velum gill symbiont]|nr:hypothetical protein BOW37_05260 [Solemya velum gill symbiont]OOZ46817.1 hypothetical protein BOW38_05475 [Solemya velum gill symbiont]OOZ50520.1 hypothetical protein BOW39_01845 [Solemya velum gill symbiont]OOZ54307.1 hypothetical protein BOW41_06025 [Solemya velum gill symbiont]OOZ57830.1 hypothetical protein BOW42_00070 [Solemya velum gill symbiont]